MTHPLDANSPFDRGRHPALFQRVSRSVPPQDRSPQQKPETPMATQSIYAAFVEFVRFRMAEISYRDDRSRQATATIRDYLDSLGFHPEEIQQMQWGIYTTADEIRGYLQSVGFSEAAIRNSGLVTDASGTFRHDWHGHLIVPLLDEHRQVVDVLAVIPPAVSGHPVRYELARGSDGSEIVAYGLATALETPAGRKNLVLVEDLLDAFFLQCRGFTNVAAVGGNGREFSARRWEDLSRLGVETVTLAFGNDATRQRDVREALDNALRARTAPEVFVLERTQLLENETLADVARCHGLEACQKAASVKSLAFHGKSFGWSQPRDQSSRNGFASPTTFPQENVRAMLRADSERISHPHERALVQQTIAEVEEALYYRYYTQARRILESRLTGPWRPTVRPEHPTTDVKTVLDRFCDETNRAAVPEHLGRYDGNELQVGTVTVLANESLRGRLADLCSRLVTALETCGDQTWVVVCREFLEDVIVLGLIAHMTRRMSSAQGLTFDEIHARLSGRDPREGYGDKPWLVDEAVDRLRRWADRLQFLTTTMEPSHLTHRIERIADEQSLGGVFFDSLPAGRNDSYTWMPGWKSWDVSRDALRELAVRHSCAVVAVTDHAVSSGTVKPVEKPPAAGSESDASPVIREFRTRIARWIEHEERQEVRVA